MQSSLVATALLAASLVALPQPSAAQSLRGSHASVSLMYRRAVRGGLDFYETSSDVKRAVIRGELVSLNGNAHYRLADIGMPYVRPETKAFVLGLAADYHRACGAPLVITSATRPISRRLANSSELSVHPTGMAVDLRKPAGRCRTWLRRSVIDATEERHPPHFHVAVLPSRYERVASARSKSGSAERSRGGR
jgi:hypothetical protein